MEILVILMLGAIFLAITMFIVSFVMIRKRHTDKAYAQGDNEYYVDGDDDEEDDDTDFSFANLFGLKENVQKEKEDEYLVEEEIETLEQPEDTSINEIENRDIQIEEVEDKNDMNQVVVIPDTVKESEEDIQEVVNILINKRNYVFLANNNSVNKGEHIKVLLNKKIYFGVVTKGNYERDINGLKVKPRKLVIIKDNKNSKKEEFVDLEDDLIFIPKKKQK